MKKIFSYLILCIFVSITYIDDVKAISFTQSMTCGCFNKSTYEYYGDVDCSNVNLNEENAKNVCTKGKMGNNYNANANGFMWYKRDTSAAKNRAYCADNGYSFVWDPLGVYSLDTAWTSTSQCKYEVDGTAYYGICGDLMGYILKEAQKKGAQYYGQAAVWGYFAVYGNETEKSINKKYNNILNSNEFKELFKTAMTNYHNGEGRTSVAPSTNQEDIIEISATNNKLKYSPSCDKNRRYISKEITISNKTDKEIEVIINTSKSENVKICQNNDNDCNENVVTKTLRPAGQALSTTTIKLQVTFNKVATDMEIPLEVTGKWIEENVQTRTTTVSSNRYIRTGSEYGSITYKTLNGNPAQALIMPDIREINTNTSITHEETEVKPFYLTALNHNDCGNNNTNKKESNCGDPNVSFNACQCMILGTGDSTVRILADEIVHFRYGNLVYNTDSSTNGNVSSGTGFRFVKDGEENGNTTYYYSKIKWRFADTNKNNTQYYQISNNDVYNLIKTKLTSLSTSPFKQLKFKTIDSNDKTKNYNYELNIGLNEQVSADKTTISYQNKSISLSKSYFSKIGNVKYSESPTTENNEKFEIDGGNYYYTPMGYNGTFNFDIKEQNLSLIGENYQFQYNGTCEIPIKDYYNNTPDPEPSNPSGSNKGLRYRSIDVNKPFPKVIPLNWKEWYENATNKNRITNSYETSILYNITLDRNNLSKIKSNQINYSSWGEKNTETSNSYNSGNINVTGNSDFINETDLFDDPKANNTSYCPIGNFNKNCDQ